MSGRIAGPWQEYANGHARISTDGKLVAEVVRRHERSYYQWRWRYVVLDFEFSDTSRTMEGAKDESDDYLRTQGWTLK